MPKVTLFVNEVIHHKAVIAISDEFYQELLGEGDPAELIGDLMSSQTAQGGYWEEGEIELSTEDLVDD